MNALLQFFHPRPSNWESCRAPMDHERMARYSQRHADDMRMRENLGAAAPRVRLVDGRAVLVALPGRVNTIAIEDN